MQKKIGWDSGISMGLKDRIRNILLGYRQKKGEKRGYGILDNLSR